MVDRQPPPNDPKIAWIWSHLVEASRCEVSVAAAPLGAGTLGHLIHAGATADPIEGPEQCDLVTALT